MKNITISAQATFGSRLGLAQLVEMYFTDVVRVATCRDDIVWNGNTYIGGRQTAIDSIKDQGGQIQGLSFQLSGVSPDTLALALGENVQGKIVKVYTAIFDPDTLAILDVLPAWSGTCDQMPISESPASVTVTVTAEHRGITFARPKGYKYTDGDQQRLYPSDKCLEFILAQSTHQDIWPAAAFFRQ